MNDVVIGQTASGRRSFPLGFRVNFLREWDLCVERGAKTRLLREHQLNPSTVDRWLAARARGEWTAAAAAAAERSPHRMESRDRAELARLRMENEALKKKVAQSEAAQQILGKAFELLVRDHHELGQYPGDPADVDERNRVRAVVEATQALLTATVTALDSIGMQVNQSCDRVGLARSTYYRRSRGYRHYQPVVTPVPHAQRRQPAALRQDEKDTILGVLTAEEYADWSVVQTYWRAFDAGLVACSERTFYRIAAEDRLVGDRRRTRTHGSVSRRTPAVATFKVGDLWSWDITELRGPGRLDRYYLYLIIDVFSRYPVGWCIEYAESKQRAVTLFTDSITSHGAPRVVHADNGAAMRSHALVNALTAAGVITSFSRPRVSDDNPFSESLFKTIKYDLDCPERFDSIEHAREWTNGFLHRYATEHRHSGLGHHTPASVHDGTAEQIRTRRQATLDAYWTQHPERFRQRPTAPHHPHTTGINPHLLSQTG